MAHHFRQSDQDVMNAALRRGPDACLTFGDLSNTTRRAMARSHAATRHKCRSPEANHLDMWTRIGRIVSDAGGSSRGLHLVPDPINPPRDRACPVAGEIPRVLETLRCREGRPAEVAELQADDAGPLA